MKKILRRAALVLAAAAAALVLIVGGYILYMVLQYSRIPDNTPLAVTNQQSARLSTGVEYTASTYNVGFGAYDHAFSFFMDSGTMLDGTKVQGVHSRAQSRAVVNRNINGAAGAISSLAPDFCLFQEVDTDATRSFHIDESAMIKKAFPGSSAVFASNFHSAFLAYPFYEMHGSVQAGLLTLSKYKINSAVRRSYPVDGSFPTKFFDLDRCFSVQRLSVSGGKDLVLINSHMSAYDKGGTVRAAQLRLLSSVLSAEYRKGNYVIVGGDFNHALCGTVKTFASQQKVPEWVYEFSDSDLPAGFGVVRASNVTAVPTCRSTDMPYTKGVNYTVVIDGFIVSENISAKAENIDTDFDFSDHNPVLLTFTLR
jgi:endonuclease/exonuclease/phosphatase family metal-dependent hydrolase